MWTVVVVMRVTALKAAGSGVGAVIDYYAGLAEDRSRPGPAKGPVDYYLDPDEPAGRWWGTGRAALGVSGEVNGEDLRSLLEGRHLRTGRSLGQGFGDRSARAFDATFSAPKSVSALWALSPDRFVRAEVLAAHDTAVDAALGWLESHGAVTRRGAKGVFQVDTRGLTAALFRQHTSRTADPQLHTHAVITAKVQDPTGKWLSLDARFLMRQQRTIGWVYDAALRADLTHRLGVAWEQPGTGPFDLVCIPQQVRDALSQRSVQVEAKLAELIGRWSDEHDGADPDTRTIAALQRKAAITSRPGKGKVDRPESLRHSWTETAEAVGLDIGELSADRIRSLIVERSRGDEPVIAEALARVAEEGSTWLRADLARHIATLVSTGPDLTAVEQVATIRICGPTGTSRYGTGTPGPSPPSTPTAPSSPSIHDAGPWCCRPTTWPVMSSLDGPSPATAIKATPSTSASPSSNRVPPATTPTSHSPAAGSRMTPGSPTPTAPSIRKQHSPASSTTEPTAPPPSRNATASTAKPASIHLTAHKRSSIRITSIASTPSPLASTVSSNNHDKHQTGRSGCDQAWMLDADGGQVQA